MRTSIKLIILAFIVLLSSAPVIIYGKVEPLAAIIPAYIVGYIILQVSYVYRTKEREQEAI